MRLRDQIALEGLLVGRPTLTNVLAVLLEQGLKVPSDTSKIPKWVAAPLRSICKQADHGHAVLSRSEVNSVAVGFEDRTEGFSNPFSPPGHGFKVSSLLFREAHGPML